jgi:hypothetical protein
MAACKPAAEPHSLLANEVVSCLRSIRGGARGACGGVVVLSKAHCATK